MPLFQALGTLALGLSLLTFAFFFLNVPVGGPLGMKPWMSDLGELQTLLVAVILFVAGTRAREIQAGLGESSQVAAGADIGQHS